MRQRRKSNIKLAHILIRPGRRHSYHSPLIMLQSRVNLIFKRAAPDRSATRASVGRITRLAAKGLDDAVEDAAVVLARGGQGQEVLAGFGGIVGPPARV